MNTSQSAVGAELVVGEVDVFVGANYVLSVRNRSQRSFLGVRERCEREPSLLAHGAGFVLYALMVSVVDDYFPIIDALEEAAFPPNHQPEKQTSWGGNYSEFPPVLVARLKR